MIDRVALHGTPGDGAGTVRMHEVQPYEGDPKPTVTLSIKRLEGAFVHDDAVILFFTHTDEHGVPHYRRRGALK